MVQSLQFNPSGTLLATLAEGEAIKVDELVLDFLCLTLTLFTIDPFIGVRAAEWRMGQYRLHSTAQSDLFLVATI